MKNNGKTEANKENSDELTWDFELVWDITELKWDNTELKWDNTELKWDLNIEWDNSEIELTEIDYNWSSDDDLWETKNNSEENVKEANNGEIIVKKQKGNRRETEGKQKRNI